MEDRHRARVLLAEPTREHLGEHDAAVIAAGAADPDRQPRLALRDVRGDGEFEEAPQEVEELARDRLIEDVGTYLVGQAGAWSQIRHVIRIRDEPDIENEVGLE